MLPISEFHFAFCGIATVAATLGYACARRAALALASPSKADVETGPSEERSLKRKLDPSDEHDADPEEHPRPMKRNRTPPTDKHDPDEDEWEVIVAPPPYEQAIRLQPPQEPVQAHSSPSHESPLGIPLDVTPAREPIPPAHPHSGTSSQPGEKGVEAERCSTPQPPQANPSANEPETPPTPPVTPLRPTVPVQTKPTNALSAFSSSSSPFASYFNPSGVSPFVLSGHTIHTTPAWKRDHESDSDVFGQARSTNALAPSPNDAFSSATTKSPSLSRVSHDIQSPVKLSTYLTGEENETVEAELKGVKLFIKRGCKEFTDGMYGHIKLLTQKSSPQTTSHGDLQVPENSSRTRLLFRRDPLGQVSMNVGLHPGVRCHFDTAENTLRVILMEQVTPDETSSKDDIVIYALKPGRAGKTDFQSFSKALCDHEALRSRVAASSAAAGDTAAP